MNAPGRSPADSGSPFWSSVAGGDIDRARPRVLLLSYHFPPGHGVGGARWEHFAPTLVDGGWGLDVITLDPSSVSDPAWDRLDSLPDHVRLFGVPQPRVWAERVEGFLGSALGTIKDLLPRRDDRGDGTAGRESPDRAEIPGMRGVAVDELPGQWSGPRAVLRAFWARVGFARERAWIRDAVGRARGISSPGRHRVIVTTAPPHLTHVAGRTLAEETGLPLVLDFRDAWKVTEVLPEHLASPSWLEVAGDEEPACIRAASLVVANTEPLEDRMRREYPEAADRILTVLNGWALPRIESDRGDPAPTDSGGPGRFVIAYAGSLYLDRNPRALMRGVAAFARDRGLSPRELSLEFMGAMEDVEPGLEAMAREEGIGEHLRLHSERPRGEARRFLSRAAVLASLPQSQTLAIPSKIFEYMTCRAWILAQTHPGSATERLLRDTEADVVGPREPRDVARVLGRRYEQYRRSGRPTPMAEDHPELSAGAQAERLLDALDRWRTPDPVRT